jgi:SAM-dependent methyltransferase
VLQRGPAEVHICAAPRRRVCMRTLIKRLPKWLKTPLRRLRKGVKQLKYYGEGRFCPVCRESSRRFAPFGLVQREDARCIHCGALERHRLLWLYVTRRTNLFDGQSKRMLHVAPESCLEPILRRQLGDNYITADLSDSRAMVRMDVANISYPDQSFDVIYCSHVLEHVRDDRKAMREFYRTLKSDGWAILLVPISGEVTVEDPSVVEPAERVRLFGQKDHVRRYGRDYVDRLHEAGFNVEIIRVDDVAHSDEMLRMGLTPASGEIYHCTKRDS